MEYDGGVIECNIFVKDWLYNIFFRVQKNPDKDK